MSPEARLPPEPDRIGTWRDALTGALIAVIPAIVISEVDRAAYRTGAAVTAFLVVLGLAMRWSVAAGAAPILLVGMIAQVTGHFQDRPRGEDVGGIVVFAVSTGIVVVALRRWEGDRRRARHAAEARRRNERRLQALVDFGRRLASVTSRADLVAAVEHDICPAAGADGAVLMVNWSGSLEYVAVAGHDRAAVPLGRPAQYHGDSTPSGVAHISGRPVFVPNRAEMELRYPLVRDVVARSGQEAWVALPVPGLGVLTISFRGEQVFSPAQRAFLETLAALLGAAAERVREVEHSELTLFVNAFDAMLDAVGIHRAVRDAAGRIVDLEIEYLNPAARELLPDHPDPVGHRMAELWPESAILSRCIRVVETGEPFEREDGDVGALGMPAPGVRAVSMRASRLDADRVVVVTRDISEPIRLMREIREANDTFAMAQELARVGSWRHDFRDGRVEWSAELYRILGIPATVSPTHPTADAILGCEHPDDRARVAIEVAHALEQRAPFSFNARIVRPGDGEIREVVTAGTVVLGEAGDVVGMWGATQDVTERRRAERSRLAALDALARQREVVAELQRVILPVTMPDVAGTQLTAHYRAAIAGGAVGGDWYDAFVAPDGRLVIAIGDVAGHGIECAALANQLRVSVRVRVNDGMEPGAVLALLDAELVDAFVTCWLAAYDPMTRVLRVANAGHLPAVLSRSGSAQLVAARTAPPLGTGAVTAKELELTLCPGDVLVLATDGLVERRGEDLARGFRRLEATVPIAAQLDDPAFTLVEQLAPDGADDVCVLAVRVLGGPLDETG